MGVDTIIYQPPERRYFTKWYWCLLGFIFCIVFFFEETLFTPLSLGTMLFLAFFWENYFFFMARVLFNVLQDDNILLAILKVVVLAVAGCVLGSVIIALFLLKASMPAIRLCIIMATLCPMSLAPFLVVLYMRTTKQIRHKHMQLNRSINELDEAIANVKELKGLIPICAYCKKIRDDAGFWNELESYIQAHSQTLVEHCLCPECEKGQNS
jgi:uncharacterized membrane protein YwzB